MKYDIIITYSTQYVKYLKDNTIKMIPKNSDSKETVISNLAKPFVTNLPK